MCFLAAVACGPARDAAAVSAKKFFKPPKKQPARGLAGKIYPAGDQIGLGLYSIAGKSKVDPTKSNMARAAEHGFNLAGPYYGADWRDFSAIYEANTKGMKFVFQIREPTALRGVSVGERPAALDKLSDAAITASVREQVSAVLNDPFARATVARWSLAPEELRHWVKSEMRYLKLASQAIRDAEKALGVEHRPMWMHEPNHRNASALKKTGKYQDIISKGVYLTDMPRGDERSGYAIWSYNQITSAAKKLKKIPQAVLQLSEDFADPKTGTDPAEIRRVLRHDAYLGLVMGIKSFNIWSMYEHRPNLTTHNEQFEAYASVAEDLTGELNLQDVFLFGDPRKDLKVKVTRGEDDLKYTDHYGKTSKFDTLHFYHAALGSDRYLFLVNSTEQPMDVSISKLPSSFLLDDLFARTTTQMEATSFRHTLDVLGVAALRFRDVSTTGLLPFGSAGGSKAPEPSSALLLIGGLACGGLARRQR